MQPSGDGARPIRRLGELRCELQRTHPVPDGECGRHWGEHDRHPRRLKDGYRAAQDLHVNELIHKDEDEEGRIYSEVLQREVQASVGFRQ